MIGDLIFVRGHDWISKAIEAFDGEFSHVCVSVADDNSRILEAQGMNRSRVVPFYFDDYEIVSTNLTEEQKRKTLEFTVNHVGLGYGYWQDVGYALQDIFRIRVHYLFYNPKRPICSGLTDLFLRDIGWLENDKYVGDKTPNELYRVVKDKLNSK